VGDLMLGTDYPENRLADDDGLSLLAEAAPYLQAADVAFGNLEGVLMDGGEPEKSCKDPSLCYLFRSPARYAGHLQQAGFDVLSLANNHARDFGEQGRDASMAALDQAGIAHSGRQGDVASWQQGEYRLAMVAFAPNIDSHSLLDEAGAACLVSGLAMDHDLVLVSFHGGAEGVDAKHVSFGEEFYYGESRGNVVRFARAMVDAGADLVIGHGPHVVRAMELYQGRLIAYSLGNFATYYGISVSGDKGIAPLLRLSLDEQGRLLEGQVVSMVQRRPGGPVMDPALGAYNAIRTLTQADFAGGGLSFTGDGWFVPRVSPPPWSGESPPPVSATCDTGESAPSRPASPADPPSLRTE
jgi:poly-gamma-glutamate capsule biosynthesis protein CapA/YwtB (metallophosphatase superfamily)